MNQSAIHNTVQPSSNFDHPLLAFFVLAFLFSWTLWLPGVLKTHGLVDVNSFWTVWIDISKWIAGIGPSLAAILIVHNQDGRGGVKDLLSRVFRLKIGWWALPTLLLIPVTLILAHLINSVIFGVSFPQTGLLSEPWWIPVLLAMFFVMQAGEEYGWRGFALDRLQEKWGALTSSLIIGCLWALWHVPMFLSEGFGHHDKPLSFDQFFITLIAVSVLITWVQNNTGGSLFPAFLLHAMINLSGEILPLVDTSQGEADYSAWLITNVLLIASVIIVIAIWGPRRLMTKPVGPR